MAFDYLLLPRLVVRNANAVSSYWALSPEVVLAARQMAHALARHLGVTADEAGVAIIHHHVEILGEKFRNDLFRPQQRRGAVFINKGDYADKNKHALSMQPTASMHLNISLAIRFRAGTRLEDSKIEQFLRGGRLAGGQIIEHDEIQFFTRESDLLKRLRSGHVVVERPDLLNTTEDDGDILEPFFRALGGVKTSKDSADKNAESHSWLVPATLGYAAITDIKPRHGAREGYPAAYAEPLVGLVQYLQLRKAKDSGWLPFWDYSYPEPGVFVVTHDNPVTRG